MKSLFFKNSQRLFKSAIMEIRSRVTEFQSLVLPEIKTLCAQSGVAFTFVHDFIEVPWNSASKWISPRKAMILLNVRRESEYGFWFSFFREAYHILNGEKKRLYIANPGSPDVEDLKADNFADDILIPEKFNAQIISLRREQEICDLAFSLDVTPGIVVERYRNVSGKLDSFGELFKPIDWAEI